MTGTKEVSGTMRIRRTSPNDVMLTSEELGVAVSFHRWDILNLLDAVNGMGAMGGECGVVEILPKTEDDRQEQCDALSDPERWANGK